MTTNKFTVNVARCIAYGITALVFAAAIAFNAAAGEKLWICMLYAALTVLFCWLAYQYSAVVEVSGGAIYMKWPLRKAIGMHRHEIGQAVVVDLKVFGNKNGKRHGSRYIVFSKEEMSDEQLFDMCLKWPPKDKIYLSYSRKRALKLQEFWNDKYSFYNTEEIDI